MHGFQTFYNFVRGHRSLNGLTPAQAAGITDEKLNWVDIINLTMQQLRLKNSSDGICQKKAKPSKDG